MKTGRVRTKIPKIRILQAIWNDEVDAVIDFTFNSVELLLKPREFDELVELVGLTRS